MSPEAKPPIEKLQLPGYHGYFNHAARKGYSGTAIYTRLTPLRIMKSGGISDPNGRCITAEFSRFFLVNCYCVNAGTELQNLPAKMTQFLPELQAHIESLRDVKPVILAGDLNVAHQPIDIWSTEGFDLVAGFTAEERGWIDALLRTGNWIDAYRKLWPDKKEFTYFDFMGGDRKHNKGWRIDYFVVSKTLWPMVSACTIDQSPKFSDHCPVVLLLDRAAALTAEDAQVSATGVSVLS
jgi:exodeoxyribonuclease-3